jgi:hypothetical protein
MFCNHSWRYCLKMAVFRVSAPYSLVEVYGRFRGTCLHHRLNFGGSKDIWNVGKLLSDYGATTQKTSISHSPSWELKILLRIRFVNNEKCSRIINRFVGNLATRSSDILTFTSKSWRMRILKNRGYQPAARRCVLHYIVFRLPNVHFIRDNL